MWPIRIHIDFPALDALVAYLIDTHTAQQQIDDLTATVVALTGRLQQSASQLDAITKGK